MRFGKKLHRVVNRVECVVLTYVEVIQFGTGATIVVLSASEEVKV